MGDDQVQANMQEVVLPHVRRSQEGEVMSIASKIVAVVVIVPLAIIGAVFVVGLLGAAVEGITDWQIEHDRCLKRATNGYEIRRCK